MHDQILVDENTLVHDKQNELLSILNNSVKTYSDEDIMKKNELGDSINIEYSYSEKKDIESFLPRFTKPILGKSYYTQTNTWICYVTSIDKEKNTFEAKLEDLNNPTTYEEAEFDMGEIPNEDLELLSLGSIFYWSIGYEHRNSQISKSSIIRFKRALSTSDIDNAKDWADETDREINWV